MPITAYEAENQVRSSSDLFEAMIAAKDERRQPDRFAVDCGSVDAEHVQTHLVPLALTYCGSGWALAEADWKGNVVLRFKRTV